MMFGYLESSKEPHIAGPVLFPDCAAKLRVPEEHWGQAIRCPKCRGIIETEPSSQGIVAVLPPQPVASRAPFAPSSRKRRFKRKYDPRFPVRTIVGMGVGGFCL